MPQAAQSTRRFCVQARSLDKHHARVLEESSFEAAAVAYVEDFSPALSEEDGISVVVRDLGTGHEHCFKVDLESGETTSCG